MQLEAGKKYTDRRGRVYGPMVISRFGLFGETEIDGGWYQSGFRISQHEPRETDLVAEYVEPVKAAEPEYRMLRDGETVQPNDEFLGYSEKWEKVPSSGNVFQSSIYYPHRRLVKPEETKAAEPADNRTAPGEGYRLLNVGEYEQEGDEYYNADKSEWVPTGLVGSRCFNGDRINGYSIRRKVEKPAPVESPDDLVIQDRVPARAGIDFGWNVSLKDWDIYKPCETWKWKIDEPYTGQMHGSKVNIGRLAVFCRRKDLPPIESPDDWVILDPVVYAEHVPRVGIDQFQVWDNQWTTQESYHSKQPIGLWYDATGGNHTRCRRKDLPPVPPQKPKTRTVVLKEWLCWDDSHPDFVAVEWSSLDPSSDDHQFEAFDHAHATRNTRTVEIPVT